MNICILVGTDNLRGEKNNLRTEFLVLYIYIYIYIISIFCTKFYISFRSLFSLYGICPGLFDILAK
jgi:hypothetical protein